MRYWCHNNQVDRELRWAARHGVMRIGKLYAMHVINSMEPGARPRPRDARLAGSARTIAPSSWISFPLDLDRVHVVVVPHDADQAAEVMASEQEP